MRKKPLIIAAALVILAGGAFTAFQLRQPAANVAEAAETVAAAQPAAIVVDGRVVPSQSADLSLPVSGIIAEVLVAEGQAVRDGQTLVRLESARQQAALAQAEAQLARAQARLAEVEAGARGQEIAAAQAALAAKSGQGLARVAATA
ncbi:MAG: biotin/lipoyl-binding protein [Caldilineales bacterium]|nr:biotin/lipoyl-binding protein [Caldilineales bacterium]